MWRDKSSATYMPVQSSHEFFDKELPRSECCLIVRGVPEVTYSRENTELGDTGQPPVRADLVLGRVIQFGR